MLIELVMTVCLAATGADCRDERIILESNGSPFHCMMESPIHIARWTESHPKWKVKRWTCVPPGKSRQLI
jgi:hypothetical protein